MLINKAQSCYNNTREYGKSHSTQHIRMSIMKIKIYSLLFFSITLLLSIQSIFSAQTTQRLVRAPMSKVEQAKQWVAGQKDYYYGKILSNPRVYERNYEKGFENPTWWREAIKEREKRAARFNRQRYSCDTYDKESKRYQHHPGREKLYNDYKVLKSPHAGFYVDKYGYWWEMTDSAYKELISPEEHP